MEKRIAPSRIPPGLIRLALVIAVLVIVTTLIVLSLIGMVRVLIALSKEVPPTPVPVFPTLTHVGSLTPASVPTPIPTRTETPTSTPTRAKSSASKSFPTPTSTRTRTPTPTPVTPTCSTAPMRGFDSIWESNSVIRERLGCPLEAEKKSLPVEEPFQNGQMFWRKDTDRIYVIHADGTWQEYEDPWREGDPQTSCQASPPAGYYQPVRGFGKVWCNQPEVREKIGWAIDVEREAKDNLIQRFEGGIVIHSPHRSFFAVLYSNGTWQEY